MGCNRPSSHMPRLQLMAFLCSCALALSPTEAAFAWQSSIVMHSKTSMKKA